MRHLLSLILLLLLVNCSSKKPNPELPLQQQHNHPHTAVMADNKTWTTENINIETEESYCLQNDTTYCKRYGRLYTWQAAKKVCGELGEGWRLPSDDEWKTLAKQYGGIVDDSNDQGHAAFVFLMDGGAADFDAMFGGCREPDGSFTRIDAHGFYWTATESDSSEAWFYNFAKGQMLVNHHTGDKKRAVSVRCVKDLN